MYAFQLPSVIPPAGTPGGPPLPENYRDFGGSAFFGDLRQIFLDCIHDPAQLQPTWDRFTAVATNAQKNAKAKK
jgi:hypothetical protein